MKSSNSMLRTVGLALTFAAALLFANPLFACDHCKGHHGAKAKSCAKHHGKMGKSCGHMAEVGPKGLPIVYTVSKHHKKGLKLAHVTLNVKGWQCGHCTRATVKEVTKLKGVTYAQANLKKKTLKVRYDASKVKLASIKKAVVKAGFKVE